MADSIFRTRDVTADQVLRLVRHRGLESERLEFKQGLGDRRNVLKTISAMVNGSGGIVIIGVTDGGDDRERIFRGVDADTAERLVNLCDTLLDPPFAPEIIEIMVDEARILIVRVDPASAAARPILFRKGSEADVYIRRGDSTRKASPAELRTLFKGPTVSAGLTSTQRLIFRPQIPNDWHNDDDIALALQVTYEDSANRGSGSFTTTAKREILTRMNSIPLTEAHCFRGFKAPLAWRVVRSSATFLEATTEPTDGTAATMRKLTLRIDVAGAISLEIEVRGEYRIDWTDLVDIVARAAQSVTDPTIMAATWGLGWKPLIGFHLRAPRSGIRAVVDFAPNWLSHDGGSAIGADFTDSWCEESVIPLAALFLATAISDFGFWDFEDDVRQQFAKYTDMNR